MLLIGGVGCAPPASSGLQHALAVSELEARFVGTSGRLLLPRESMESTRRSLRERETFSCFSVNLQESDGLRIWIPLRPVDGRPPYPVFLPGAAEAEPTSIDLHVEPGRGRLSRVLQRRYTRGVSKPDSSRLSRPLNPMPGFVRQALEERRLVAAFEKRPPFQRNDYLGWIARAKCPDTQARRLEQMLDELAAGDRYMKMPYAAKR